MRSDIGWAASALDEGPILAVLWLGDGYFRNVVAAEPADMGVVP